MSAVNSTCSDLREINEAKVNNILSYLDDMHTIGGGYGLAPVSSSFNNGTMPFPSSGTSQHYPPPSSHQTYHQHDTYPHHSSSNNNNSYYPLRELNNAQQNMHYNGGEYNKQHQHYTNNGNATAAAAACGFADGNRHNNYNGVGRGGGGSQNHAFRYDPNAYAHATPQIHHEVQSDIYKGSHDRLLRLSQQNLDALTSRAGKSDGGETSTAANEQNGGRRLEEDANDVTVSAVSTFSPSQKSPSPRRLEATRQHDMEKQVDNEQAVHNPSASLPSTYPHARTSASASPQPPHHDSLGRTDSMNSVGGGGMRKPLTAGMLRHGGGGGTTRSVSSYVSTSATSAALLLPLSSENSTHVYNGIKRKIDELKHINSELVADNDKLSAQLAKYERKEKERIAKLQDIAKAEIEGMRVEQERQQSQHTAMVKKLLKEKEALVIKCDELTTSARLLQESKSMESKRLADEHTAAINELKGKWLVQEKQRREQWMAAESKRVKENTLKAMEPDIALLMSRHKAEKARIQEECDLKLKRKDEQLAEKESGLQEARLKMSRDLEGLVLKEREQFRQRVEEESVKYQRLAEDFKRQHEDKMASANKFFEEQKQHYLSNIKDLESQLLAAKGHAAEKDATFHAAVTAETRVLIEIKEKELVARKAAMEEEMERLKSAMVKENEEAMRRKEEEYKMIMRQERDAAIAKVVQNLEDEHIRQLNNNKESSSLVREKMARQDREVERLTLEKQVLEQQTQTLIHQSKVTNELVNKLQSELQQLRDANKENSDALEHTFEQRMASLDRMWQQKLTRFESQHVEEVQQLQHSHQMASRAHHRKVEELETEIRDLESKHNSELSSINDRVVAAMAKRDAMVQMLQEQLRLAQVCVQERESELERHRMLLMDS